MNSLHKIIFYYKYDFFFIFFLIYQFLKFRQGLVDTLRDLNVKRRSEEGYSKDHFNLQELNSALNFIEADFSSKELEYLKMQLFKETFDMNRLEINSVMRIFDGAHFDNNCTFYTAEILSPKSPKRNLIFSKEIAKPIKEECILNKLNLISLLFNFKKC